MHTFGLGLGHCTFVTLQTRCLVAISSLKNGNGDGEARLFRRTGVSGPLRSLSWNAGGHGRCAPLYRHARVFGWWAGARASGAGAWARGRIDSHFAADADAEIPVEQVNAEMMGRIIHYLNRCVEIRTQMLNEGSLERQAQEASPKAAAVEEAQLCQQDLGMLARLLVAADHLDLKELMHEAARCIAQAIALCTSSEDVGTCLGKHLFDQ